MKKLKKLSLKEEIDRETRQMEKEIESRKDLDDIKVTEEMEASLFNKIQEYEYDRRKKTEKRTVRRRKKKRYIVLALAAVLILVFGSVMTGTGSKSYWKVLWERMTGEENLSHIDVEEMESRNTEDIDEVYAYKKIQEELGIVAVRFGYMPEGMYLTEYELDSEQRYATMLYQYAGKTLKYTMYMNDTDSSLGQTELDEVADEYTIDAYSDIKIDVKEYKVKGISEKRYVAEFEYMDAQYELKGQIEKEEFDKILKNLAFL
ncbi:DUF4367 domain-containing protein [Clostridium sp. Marseille-P3244]|uniref:DUF4367 domain-containing protein n=1 Tax=Clostridium sp. Marseille-P3244 TaxID=1871020 RepID=UPI0009315870|nr:DUF4367 domain-containing protein [Clostridium sp. Marseille-P3244]